MKQPKTPPREERVSPTDELMARRAFWSNGRDPNQTADTIGKMWAWGMLDAGGRHASDELRDAGRAYAAAYWSHYQRVAAAKTGSYREMLGGSIAPLVIPNPELDVVREEEWRRMDAVLGSAISPERGAVARYCVDQHGCAEPEWLRRFLEDGPLRLAEIEAEMSAASALMRSGTPEQRKLMRTIHSRHQQERLAIRPERPRDLPALHMGLGWLADHQISEKRKRRGIAEIA